MCTNNVNITRAYKYYYYDRWGVNFICITIITQTGELMTGAGVCHLIGAVGDGSQLIQPPTRDDHPEWERVFVQSRDLYRMLLPGSKYLFCETCRYQSCTHMRMF